MKFEYNSKLKLSIDQIYVFGKIPNRSISIPTITSEDYSPDFMYVVKRKNGDTELNLVVETKGKEESELSEVEAAKIKSAKRFFRICPMRALQFILKHRLALKMSVTLS